jgi:hypothetical protein
LVVRIVGVGDAVAVRVRVLAVVGVVGEGIRSIGSTVAVCVRAVGVGTLRVLLGVGQTVSVSVAVGVTGVVRVEAVSHFPTIREAVSVGVCLGHIRSVLLLFGIGETVTVPVGAAVRRVEGVGSVTADDGRSRHQDEEQSCNHAQVLSVVHFIFTSYCL